MIRVLQSKQDRSVNFVEEQLEGFLESRYVRRCEDYFVCYLSSHTGCNRGCTFCHLTATGQTSFTPTTLNDFIAQAMQVLKHHRTEVQKGAKPARYMHFAFMARGEPLANEHLLKHGAELLTRLGQLATGEGLPAKFAISTIMPQTLHQSLIDVFGCMSPTIYYSVYSANPKFRVKWLPAAMPVEEAFKRLIEYQKFSKKIVKLHHALISGENDSIEDARLLGNLVEEYGLLCEFNLVRYNPYAAEQGSEASEESILAYVDELKKHLSGGVKIVSRVGLDVKASCGMFVDSDDDGPDGIRGFSGDTR